ncbi:hypothetical protein M8J77_014163 [Diaphorina citri]|nr:hypothetical protein M8J77_014163 [Diaphorina citri]
MRVGCVISSLLLTVLVTSAMDDEHSSNFILQTSPHNIHTRDINKKIMKIVTDETELAHTVHKNGDKKPIVSALKKNVSLEVIF